MAASISVAGSNTDATDASSYSISTPYGTAAAGRITLAAWRWRNASSIDRAVDQSTSKINGLTPAFFKQAHNTEGGAAIMGVVNASATSGTTIFALDGSVNRIAWETVAVYDADINSIIDDLLLADGQISGDTTQDGSMDFVAGGVGYAYGGGSTAGAALTLSHNNYTNTTQRTVENLSGIGGTFATATAQTPQSDTFNYDVPGSETIFGRFLVGVSLGPLTADGVLSSAGIASASFTGAVNADGVLSSAGVGAALFDASLLFNSAGIAAASFVGSMILSGALAAAGVASASFNSGVLEGAFTAAGVGNAQFIPLVNTVDGALLSSGVVVVAFTGELLLRWTPEASLAPSWTEEDDLL